MTFRLRVKNLKNIERVGRKFVTVNAKAALEAYMLTAGNVIMTQSIKNAPRRFGDLRGSGYVRVTGSGAKDLKIELGHNEEYALPVHERFTNFFSGKVIEHAEGGPKFLTRAIDSEKEEAKRQGKEAAREAMRTGRNSVGSAYPYTPPKDGDL